MSLGNEDNNEGTDDDLELRMPYRKRKKFYETPQQVTPREKWREACYRLHPNLGSLSEAQKEAIESRFKVEYYIALGLDSSLPQTATSGSIETPRVSPLLQHPSRVPSRVAPAQAIPARPIEPVESQSRLTLLPNLPLQSPLSSLLSVPPLAPLSSLSSHPNLSPLPIKPLPALVTANPYLTSFYPPYEKPLITSGPIKPLQETFVKPEEEPILKSDKIPYQREEEPLLPVRYIKPLDDCFIKPIHPVSKPHKDPYKNRPKETTLSRFQENAIGDPLLKRAASSSSYLEAAEPPFKKPKTKGPIFETIDPFKSSRTPVRQTSEDRYIKPCSFFEPIAESSQHKDTYLQTEDPYFKRPDPVESYYRSSTSGLSIPKFAQSSSIYVDCPSIYPGLEYIGLREEITDNDVSITDNYNNNEENDGPIDYSLNHPTDFIS